MKYWRLPDSLIRLLNMTLSVSGRCGKYLFQMSNGGQQVKLYRPEIYRNDNNTPQRIRSRTIMRLANEDPVPTFKDKLRELYRIYPYFLLKNRSEKLRVTNFYFSRYIKKGTEIRIYKIVGSDPDPETDLIHTELAYYDKKKTITLQFTGDETERYYALNVVTERLSNMLNVYWEG